jgi:hypothetical protein
MIELDGTWNTVVMLLVAGGVGLLGGVGAAFIEWRQRCSAANPAADRCKPRMGVFSCIVLGGIAAVAILYFFPPTETKEVIKAGEEVEKVTFYDLTELVALSLIVGSAGAVFLQALQNRTLALTKAQQAAAGTATAIKSIDNLPKQAEEATEAGVRAASTRIKSELQKAASLPADQADKIVEKLADEAATSVAENLESQAEAAQQMIAAAASGDPVPTTVTGR